MDIELVEMRKELKDGRVVNYKQVVATHVSIPELLPLTIELVEMRKELKDLPADMQAEGLLNINLCLYRERLMPTYTLRTCQVQLTVYLFLQTDSYPSLTLTFLTKNETFYLSTGKPPRLLLLFGSRSHSSLKRRRI
ncbi:hypothetical protein [Gelidibacter gilvus]|uniref:Uncharacterized protein n=1 Tax=Gelidibacter gilvus TaxID=59602 RepID=A0A4Q0XI11_9FLAO|nr:hypothetical protein [Gelidibacter gilvus]RXJ51224.1 hypothetical protein ESZ48_04950 [Gelidibacter gilvus]